LIILIIFGTIHILVYMEGVQLFSSRYQLCRFI
jgi:hypothetical protein